MLGAGWGSPRVKNFASRLYPTLVITEKPFEMSPFQCGPCAAWAFRKLSEAYHLSLALHITSLLTFLSGPAESLFKESYYQLMKTALREDGILCCQGEDAVSGQRLMPDHCMKSARHKGDSSWGHTTQGVKSVSAPRYRSIFDLYTSTR